MKLKPGLNHQQALQALDALGPEGRLKRAMALSDETKAFCRAGLRSRFPKLSEEQLLHVYLERMKLCHNRNY